MDRFSLINCQFIMNMEDLLLIDVALLGAEAGIKSTYDQRALP